MITSHLGLLTRLVSLLTLQPSMALQVFCTQFLTWDVFSVLHFFFKESIFLLIPKTHKDYFSLFFLDCSVSIEIWQPETCW